MTTQPNPRSRVTWVLAATVLASACAGRHAAQTARPRTEVVTVQRITDMVENGSSFEDIQGRIQESGTVYRLTDDQQQRLRGTGFSATLLSFMQLTYTHAVETNPSLGTSDEKWHRIDGYWYGGRPFGWPEEWVVGAPRFGEKLRTQ
jgi:hypothetical protein